MTRRPASRPKRYVTHIGNAHFAWFQSTPAERINFCSAVPGDIGYRINDYALGLLHQQGLSQP